MYRFFVSVLGTGLSPFAPGTCGSAVGALLFLVAWWLGATPLVMALVMIMVAVYGAVITVTFGKEAIEKHGDDPSLIVSDELCGQAITYLGLGTLVGVREVLIVALVGFVLFRFFDIIKPWPACYFDRQKNVWGVLLDDVAAGVYAAICLQIIWRFMIVA